MNHDFQIICHPSDTLVPALQFLNHLSNPASVTEGHVVGWLLHLIICKLKVTTNVTMHFKYLNLYNLQIFPP